jgi:hypothetical protein
MKVALVHGFNVWDRGKKSIDTLAPFFRRVGDTVDVDEYDYGLYGLLRVRFVPEETIIRLAKGLQSADLIITHSNGANFTTQALNLLPTTYDGTKLVVHINPALDVDTPIPSAVKEQLVIYNPSDFWVKVAAKLRRHPWGKMGAVGYQGPGTNNTNVEGVGGHSGNFKIDQVAKTYDTIHRWRLEKA